MSRRYLSILLVPIALAVTSCSSTGTPDATSGSSSTSTATTGAPGAAQEIEVTLSDDGCEPRSISATAGPATFKVTNDNSASVTEFEILDNGKVVAEAENVIPGADRSISITLAPGRYETLCPNGAKFDNGTLDVADAPKGVAADEAERKKATEAYLTYVKGQADLLIAKTTAFAAAVKSGNVDQTKALFAAARAPYEAIEPIAESFGDLDPAIDAREGDVPDDEWGGFHRIEKAAWDGADLSEMGPVADKLVADVKDLRAKIDTVELEPSQIANGAVDLLNEISTSKIPKEATKATAGAPVAGEEDRYSGTDLSDVAANLAGAKAAFAALEPLIKASDAKVATDLETKFAASEKELAKFSGTDPAGNGYVFFTTLTPAKAAELAAAVDGLAVQFATVAPLVL